MWPLLLAAFIEFGIYPINSTVMYTPSPQFAEADGTGYITLGVSAKLWGFFFEGEVNTEIKKAVQSYFFDPIGMSYQIGMGWKNDWIELGWMHECSHPVVAYYPIYPGTFNWEGAVERLYTRISIGGHE